MRRVVLFTIVSALATVSHAASNEWRLMPVRTQGQLERGEIGGRAEQWMQGGARCKANPNVVYLSHDCGGFWRSDNGGQTWGKPLAQGLYVPHGQSIEVDPVDCNRVMILVDTAWDFKHTSYGGIYLSEDGGDNWTFVKNGPTMNSRRYERNIAFAPSSADTQGATIWYAALYNEPTESNHSQSALFRSTDRGHTFTQRASLSAYYPVYEVKVSPTDSNLLLVTTGSGLLRSTDGGSTLAAIGNLPSGEVTSVAFSPQNSQIIYAAVQGSSANGLYRSTNGGSTFTRLSSGDSFHNSVLQDARRVFIHPSNGNIFYVIPQNRTSSRTAIRTDNGGSTYATTSISLPSDVAEWRWGLDFTGNFSFILMSATDSQQVVAQSGGAVMYRSTNGTVFLNGSDLFEGANCSGNNYAIAFDKNDPKRFVASFQDIGTFVTKNGADSFVDRGVPSSLKNSGLIPWTSQWTTSINPTQPNNWISAAGNSFDKLLVRTTDAGANWTLVDSVADYYFRVFHHPTAPTYVFAGRRRSTNSGASFSNLSISDSDAQVLDYCPSQPDMIYAVSGSGRRIWRSLDKGNTWSVYVSTSWSLTPYDVRLTFAIDPANCKTIYTIDSSGDLARYNGTSWASVGLLSQVSRPAGYFAYVRSVLVDPNHPEVIYATIFGHGISPFIFRSVDSGGTWQDISLNHFRQGQDGININPHSGEVMIGGCSGTWVLPPPYPSSNGIYDKLPSQGTPKGKPPNAPQELNISSVQRHKKWESG